MRWTNASLQKGRGTVNLLRMAIEFARVRYVKRSDGGNVCRSAAYNARTDLRSQRTGEQFSFSRRDGLLDHQLLLPAGAQEFAPTCQQVWNAAQAAERRKDAQEARELLLALPSDEGLGLGDWQTLTREFGTEQFVTKGVAVQIDIHAPHEGDRNVHAHLLISTRRLEGRQFASTKARDLDPIVRRGQGGRPMVAEGEAWGALWRDHQNRYFEKLGLGIRVNENGIVPQRHEGPIRLRVAPAAARARARATRIANDSATRDPQQVLAAVSRRSATFTELDVERQLRQAIGDARERAVLRAAVLAQPEVIALHGPTDGTFTGRYTTVAVHSLGAAHAASTALVRHCDSVTLYVSETVGEASFADFTAAEVANVAAPVRTDRSSVMQEPQNRRRRLEDQGMPRGEQNSAPGRQIDHEDQYRRDLAGAEIADRQEAAAIESERAAVAFQQEEEAKRERFAKEEAERQARQAEEARLALEREQAQLRQAQQAPPPLHNQFTQFTDRRAAKARQETGIMGPEGAARAREMPSGDPDAFPASASVRYSEALARHYDGRDPYATLAQAGLAEAAAFKREQHELNRQIAIEADPARRDMLIMRRSIEHNDHMGQSWERIAGTSKAVTGRSDHPDVLADKGKAGDFQAAAREDRQEWERRCLENPALYPPLNEQMRARVELRRETQGLGKAAPEPERDAGQKSGLEAGSKVASEPTSDRERRLASWHGRAATSANKEPGGRAPEAGKHEHMAQQTHEPGRDGGEMGREK